MAFLELGNQEAAISSIFYCGTWPLARTPVLPDGLTANRGDNIETYHHASKNLCLNPPFLCNFTESPVSRWPATRNSAYWYPVWLAYPAGMLEGSRLLDAPAAAIFRRSKPLRSAGNRISGVVTSTPPGFPGDILSSPG